MCAHPCKDYCAGLGNNTFSVMNKWINGLAVIVKNNCHIKSIFRKDSLHRYCSISDNFIVVAVILLTCWSSEYVASDANR